MNEESVHEVAPQNNEATDRKSSYNRDEKIKITKNRINTILKPLGNEVFVFDFGHYYHDEAINDNNEAEQHFEFQSVIQGSKKYIETLFPNYDDEQTDYRYFERDIKEVCNISAEKENEIKQDEEKTYITPKKAVVSKKPFKTEDWAKALAKNTDIGGCLLVSSIVKGNHQSAVWVVLKKPITGLSSYDKKVFCYMSCEHCSERGKCKKKRLNKEIFDDLFSRINELLSHELVYNTELEISRQSTRAAIFQVFVRNLSHNLVPNVLEHLRDKQSFDYFDSNKLINKPNAYTSDISLPILSNNQQVANLISYISNRCLYLSKATLGVAKEDGVHRVYGELFKNLDDNRIMLNHISGKEDFKYRINFMHNGDPLKDDNDISVSLPTDALGAQAFYIILENIISNTAKHNPPKTDAIVDFYVNFIDEPLEHPFAGEDKYYRVEIWDNVPVTETEKKLKEEIDKIKKDYQYASYFGLIKEKDASISSNKGTDNISDSCADNNEDEKEAERIKDAADLLVYKLNTQLNNTIALRTNFLGLIEMEASAAFLRQEDLSEIESKYYDLKQGQHYNKFDYDDNYYLYFIQAFKNKLDCNKGFSLGYRFYMKKPDALKQKF